MDVNRMLTIAGGTGVGGRAQIVVIIGIVLGALFLGMIILAFVGSAAGKFTDKLTDLAFPYARSGSGRLSLFGYLWLGSVVASAITAFIFLSCWFGTYAIVGGGLFALCNSTKFDPPGWESS